MIPNIRDQIKKEFEEKFCWNNFDGEKHYKSLRTNIDQTEELWAFLDSTISLVQKETKEEIIKRMKETMTEELFAIVYPNLFKND